MKKIIILVFMFLLFNLFPAYATPPTDIKATYDNERGVLHLEMTHPSHKLDKFFIRKVIIRKNNEKEPQIFYFTRQDQPEKFTADITFSAKPGDMITIEAYANEGGVKEQSYTIPAPGKRIEDKVESEKKPQTPVSSTPMKEKNDENQRNY